MKTHITLILFLFSSVFSFAQISKHKSQLMKKKAGVEACYSPDGTILVTGSSQFLNIFYAGSKKPNKIIKTKFGIIDKVLFTDNKSIIVTGSGNFNFKKKKIIQSFDIETGSSIGEIEIKADLKKTQKIISLGALSKYAVIADEKLLIFDGDKKLFSSTENYTSIYYTKQSNLIYLGNNNGIVTVFDAATSKIIKTLTVSDLKIVEINTSPSGNLIACADVKGNVYILNKKEDYKSLKITGTYDNKYKNVAFSYDEQYLVSTCKFNFQIWKINNSDLFIDKHVVKKGIVSKAIFDPTGKYLTVLGFESNRAELWNCLSLNISPYIEYKDDNDQTPPQIVLTNPKVPKDRATVQQETINLQGLVIDDKGVQEVKVNGQKANLSAVGDFNVKLNLAIGENKIAIEASDINGNTAIKKISIFRKEFDLDALSLESKNHILIISIDDYAHWPKLNNAVSDADHLEKVLKSKYGFEEANIIRVQDTLANRQGIIDGFKKLIGAVGPNDNVIVYFSGHGYFDAELGEGYWIPVDAKKGADGDYLPNSFMMQLMKKVNSKHLFLVADACFSGSLFNNSNRGYTENVGSYKSRWGLASGRLEYVSDGKVGEHSPFNKYLVEYLIKNDKSEFSVSEMIQYVKIKVANETSQSPIGNPLTGLGDEGGEFIFKVK
ncbi:MAG: caspase family protein [Crocinitomicaceae bacterium]